MAAKKLKLGMIGMSEGNGHPYSWSAIFNGFDPLVMAECPFPVISEYLARQTYPDDFLTTAKVTHVWTQEPVLSQHIARAALIPNVVDKPEDMIGVVDAVLIARDDAELHFELALPFINAGMPVFIDKPLAFTVAEAKKILALAKHDNQIFSCSSLRYAQEFQLHKDICKRLGRIKFAEAVVGKSWKKYAVHVIEPLLNLLPDRGKLLSVVNTGWEDLYLVTTRWENAIALIKVTESLPSDIRIRLYGEHSFHDMVFSDSFSAFKASLEVFISVMQKGISNIPVSETLEVISIIEKGSNE